VSLARSKILLYWFPCFFQAGANMIVSGTAVIGAEDPGKVIATMRDVVEGSIQKCQLER